LPRAEHSNSHCNTLQRTATHCKTLQRTARHCNTLQHAATRCNTLQHTATHCNTLRTGLSWMMAGFQLFCRVRSNRILTATHYHTLHHTATHCNTLQHTATRCNTLRTGPLWMMAGCQLFCRVRSTRILSRLVSDSKPAPGLSCVAVCCSVSASLGFKTRAWS